MSAITCSVLGEGGVQTALEVVILVWVLGPRTRASKLVGQ